MKKRVRRNLERFPEDFLLALTEKEVINLRSHFATSSWGGHRYVPMAFTEQGVAMLSSVLRSPRAVAVNIEIMRAFLRLRQILSTHKELAKKLSELEVKLKDHDEKISLVFDAIRQLMVPSEKSKKKIGFTVKEKQAAYSKCSKKK